MGVSKKELGALNVDKFAQWRLDIETRNIQEFKNYYQPTNGELNKTQIAKDSGIGSAQAFKENQELKSAYADLIESLQTLGLLRPKEPGQPKVRVIKEAYSSTEQLHKNQQLETAQAQLEMLKRENQQLKKELAKYTKLQAALYDVTEIFPRD